MTNPNPARPNMRMRYGIHRPLEEEADALIYGQVRKIKKHSENDILTPWKEKDRRKHEIYVPSGTPDPASRLGIYHRSLNPARPDLDAREGVARYGSRRVPRSNQDDRVEHHGDSLHSFVWGAPE